MAKMEHRKTEKEGCEWDVSNVRKNSTDNIVFICCILILQAE